MLRNYLSIAFRNVRRRFGYTTINVVGLSVALCCCLLIVSFIRHELSYDRFHEKADRIYRVNTAFSGGGTGSFTDGRVGPALADQFPQIETAVRLSRTEHLVRHGDESLYGWDVVFTDTTFFDVFDFELLQGDRKSALSDPYSIVISETMADVFFSGRDPIGESLTLDGKTEFTVSGVAQNVPAASHYRFDAIAPIAAAISEKPWLEQWGSISLQTYVVLAAGARASQLEAPLAEFAALHYDGGQGRASRSPVLYPLTDIHLHSTTYELEPQSSIRSVRVTGTIGLFILLLALVNYMNLATARAVQRAREVGVRKVAGASRAQLIAQFLSESVSLSLLSLVLGVSLAIAAKGPVMALFEAGEFPLAFVHSPSGILMLTGAGLLVGMLAGLYPAFVLTRFKPVDVLKGIRTGGRRSRFRQILVTSQFVVSIVLLGMTFTVQRQHRFMESRDLGFDQENVVNIQLRDPVLIPRAETLQEGLRSDARVMNATISSTGVSEFSRSASVTRTDIPAPEHPPTIGFIFTDAAFVGTMDMQIVAGRNFEASDDANSAEVILSEEAVRRLEFESNEAAIGAGLTSGFFNGELTVRGVVGDFHVRSLRSPITPVMLLNSHLNDDAILSVRLAPGDQAATLDFLRSTWRTRMPDWPFEYVYLDEELQQRAAESERMADMFGFFSGLAIFIGCLGLLGLAAHAATIRTREIGIRKALGATARQIVLLLSKEFAVLIGLSALIAAPIVRKSADAWLNDFAYRVDWSWDAVIWAGLLTLGLAVVSVSVQAARAALVNPVEALKEE